jgi:hypothetical protein
MMLDAFSFQNGIKSLKFKKAASLEDEAASKFEKAFLKFKKASLWKAKRYQNMKKRS